MKLWYLLVFLAVMPSVFALNIDLSINKVFSIETIGFAHNNSGENFFSAEVINSGSIPYPVQARVDVFDGNNTIFTGWTIRKGLMPGNNFPFVLFWEPPAAGTYTARLRLYYGGEMQDTLLNFTASKKSKEDIFQINDVKVFNKYILVGITSGKDVRDVAVIPSDYDKGWIFTEGYINSMKSGEKYYATILHDSAAWYSQSLKITAATRDGTQASSKVIKLEKEEGIEALVFNLIFGLIL